MIPGSNEPSTLGEQLISIPLSLQAAEKNGTTAKDEWEAAQENAKELNDKIFPPEKRTDTDNTSQGT